MRKGVTGIRSVVIFHDTPINFRIVSNKSLGYSANFDQLHIREVARLLRRFYEENESLCAIKSYGGLWDCNPSPSYRVPHNHQINIPRDREYQRANNVYIGRLKRKIRGKVGMICIKLVISGSDLNDICSAVTYCLKIILSLC